MPTVWHRFIFEKKFQTLCVVVAVATFRYQVLHGVSSQTQTRRCADSGSRLEDLVVGWCDCSFLALGLPPDSNFTLLLHAAGICFCPASFFNVRRSRLTRPSVRPFVRCEAIMFNNLEAPLLTCKIILIKPNLPTFSFQELAWDLFDQQNPISYLVYFMIIRALIL